LAGQFGKLVQNLSESADLKERTALLGRMKILIDEIDELISLDLGHTQQNKTSLPYSGGNREAVIASRVSRVSILVVDDFVPFRQFVCSMLKTRPELLVVAEASDGLEAIRKAQVLFPDLILLDINLPKLNGIETARRIRKVAPDSKIIFLSRETSANVVQEAIHLGALGYMSKGKVGTELLVAIGAVLQGKHFVSTPLSDGDQMDGQI
jgi:CheY-like chemotaxis protein